MKLSLFFQKLHKKIRFFLNETGYTCDYCGAEVFSYPTERLCVACEEGLDKNNGKTCIKCGRKTVTEGVCLTCKSALPAFSVGYSPFVYRGEAASLVNRMKNSTPRLTCYLGEKMAEYLLEKRANLAENKMPILVMPIPLTKKREEERGYNQAYLLAESVCKRLQELGVETELSADALQKVKDTEMQKHMTRKERANNVKGAFHLHQRKLCRDRRVILIDDIMTTGATASECAEKIIGAGAQEVMLLVAAALPERK
jgi:ComF family protein